MLDKTVLSDEPIGKGKFVVNVHNCVVIAGRPLDQTNTPLPTLDPPISTVLHSPFACCHLVFVGKLGVPAVFGD